MILERLEERAQWLTASEDVQIAKVRARRCFEEVARVILRLEQLADQRKERIKELARLRALEEETTQVRNLSGLPYFFIKLCCIFIPFSS